MQRKIETTTGNDSGSGVKPITRIIESIRANNPFQTAFNRQERPSPREFCPKDSIKGAVRTIGYGEAENNSKMVAEGKADYKAFVSKATNAEIVEALVEVSREQTYPEVRRAAVELLRSVMAGHDRTGALPPELIEEAQRLIQSRSRETGFGSRAGGHEVSIVEIVEQMNGGPPIRPRA